MNTLTRTIIYNAHPSSLILGVGAVLAGLTASVIRGGVTFLPALMTLLFAIFLQASGNLYNGYSDISRGGGENIAGMDDRNSRALNSSKVRLLHAVANAFGILTLTTGLALFSFVGWLGVAYLAVIVLILYFYFAGPSPIVNTRWSILVTFFLFGPVAVSGTAVVQNPDSCEWLPVVVYSLISGFMASNAHVAIQYLRYDEDRVNGRETLVTLKGMSFTRYVYLANALAVALILIIRPSAVEFVSPWVGICIAVVLIVSSIGVFSVMGHDSAKVSRIVRNVTMGQYILIIIVLLCIVLYAFDDSKFYFIRLI